MLMQTRPENRGELGWREALAAKRLPQSGMGGPRTQCVCVGVGGGTPGPAHAPDRKHPPLSAGEKRNVRGEGTGSREYRAV